MSALKNRHYFVSLALVAMFTTARPQDNADYHIECGPSYTTENDPDAACKRTSNSPVCEGRGTCVCGECVCNPVVPSDSSKRYRGIYCECNDYSCSYHDFKLCGGHSRGICQCGECTCTPGYAGSNCGCATDQTTCIASNGKVCNDVGICVCGSCTCDPNSQYRGQTCEDCPSCTAVCEKYKACVLCRMFPEGNNRMPQEYCAAQCTNLVAVDVLQYDADTQTFCTARDESDNCDYFFAYDYYSKVVYAQRTKACLESL